ncbi:restriction endonuclease subunit S [Xanthobacter autotrophicus]|uniref:restriction endonuclease subunit S n=1 Tax=Xanthobacter autotrophicus TaxID=280 RepID=UPI00372B6CC3
MGEIAPLVRRPVLTRAEELYREIGIRSFGKGVFHKAPVTGLDIADKRVFTVEPGDLLFNIVFAWEGAVAVATEAERGMIGSHRFLTCVTDKSKADARFLNYWFTQAEGRDQLLRASPGGAGRNRTLGVEKLAAIHVPLPPLDEQRRIVARIEELAAKAEEARQLRSMAQEEAGAIFSKSVGSLFDSRSVGWTASNVNEVAQSLDAGWSPQCEDAPANEGQWGILKTTSVQWCEFWPHENKRLPLSAAARVELSVKAGDVLVTRAGPMKRVGVPATARKDHPNLMISDKLIRIRPKLDMINPRFLEYALSSPQAQGHLIARKTGLADAQVNISQSILRATPFSYPSLEAQSNIVAELDALQSKLNALKALQAETAAELDAMLPAILDKAFKGGL